LTLDNYSRGDMSDPDGRIGDVDVLTATAGGSVGVDTQIIRIDVDLDVVVDLGKDKNSRE
jgi:hypothetical protein